MSSQTAAWESVQRKYRGVADPAPTEVTLAASPKGKVAHYLSLAAIAMCGLLMYSKVEKARKEDGSATKVIGSTAPRNVVLSSLPGFLFAMSYYGLRAQVRDKSEQYTPSYIKDRVQPSTMPLIAAGFVSTAAESMLLSHVNTANVEPFHLGNALGILVGAMAANKLFSDA